MLPGVPLREHVLKRDDLAEVSELFLTGTTSEVLPIVTVDGKAIADGRPGPITRRLQDVYRQAVHEVRRRVRLAFSNPAVLINADL